MREIEATIRDGQVVTEVPLNLPDGTIVKIQTPEEGVDIWENSPEGLKAWHAWFDSIEPVVFTPEEEAELAKYRAEQREWELAHFDERMDKLKKMWE